MPSLPLTSLIILYFGSLCTGLFLRFAGPLHYGEPQSQAHFAQISGPSSLGLVSLSQRPQIPFCSPSTQSSVDSVCTSFTRPWVDFSHRSGSDGDYDQRIVALRMVLEAVQAQSQQLPKLRWHLARSRFYLCSSGSLSKPSCSAPSMGRRRRLGSLGTSLAEQSSQRPKSPRRGQKGKNKGKGKGKQKSKQGSQDPEPSFGPSALGIKIPSPPWKPSLSGNAANPGSTSSANAVGDSQLRGFLNEMKKVADLPADGHAIIQKYQKKQRTATTKTMHQSVTEVSQAREALDKAHLARHQLHTSWRAFLSEALETFQAYTEGFKQQEAALVAGIEDAKQQLIAAKETFEECRSA